MVHCRLSNQVPEACYTLDWSEGVVFAEASRFATGAPANRILVIRSLGWSERAVFAEASRFAAGAPANHILVISIATVPRSLVSSLLFLSYDYALVPHPTGPLLYSMALERLKAPPGKAKTAFMAFL